MWCVLYNAQCPPIRPVKSTWVSARTWACIAWFIASVTGRSCQTCKKFTFSLSVARQHYREQGRETQSALFKMNLNYTPKLDLKLPCSQILEVAGQFFSWCLWVTFTHPLIGHTDDSSITADHEDNQAKQRDVPSAKKQQQRNTLHLKQDNTQTEASKSIWTFTFPR